MNKNYRLGEITSFYIIIVVLINIVLFLYSFPFSFQNKVLFLVFSIDFLLVLFYMFLFKKIKSLSKFDEMQKELHELKNSRSLFLQNINHELKTPITKGKLISETLEDNRKKEILVKTFYRLEYLLGEFSKIEELTSEKIKLNKSDFKALDLVNQAIDTLLLDSTKVDISSSDMFVNVDFKLFCIALKNLIDNSIKYSINENPKIILRKNYIKIKNKGDKLPKAIEEYFKPFNREYESIDKSLGLGLFIANAIIKKHGFKLAYLYLDEYHIFKITFKK